MGPLSLAFLSAAMMSAYFAGLSRLRVRSTTGRGAGGAG